MPFDKDCFLQAARFGYLNTIEEVLSEYPDKINDPLNMDAWNALIAASENGHVEIVRLLLSHPKIDVNIRNKDGTTALLFSSMNGHTEIVKQLIAHPNIDVNIKGRKNWTAFLWASMTGRTEIIKQLLSHPNIDINDKDNRNAIFSAASNGHAKVVELLLSRPLSQCLLFVERGALLKHLPRRNASVIRAYQTALRDVSASILVPLYRSLVRRMNSDVVSVVFQYYLAGSTTVSAIYSEEQLLQHLEHELQK